MAISFLLVSGFVVHEYKKGPLFITERGRDFVRDLNAEALKRIANKIEGRAKGNGKSGPAPVWQATASVMQTLSDRIETARRSLPREYPLRAKAEILAARIAAGLPEMPVDQMYVLWTNAQKYMSGPKEILRLAAPMLLNAIEEERQRRGSEAISLLPNGGFFRWPSTKAEHGDGLLQFEADAFGVLAQAGYRVGVARGEPEFARRRTLARLFEDAITQGPAREWGSKGSARRLKKLADTIAALTRNAKRRGPQMARAVAEWEADLGYLHDRYYVGKFDFPWPSTAGTRAR